MDMLDHFHYHNRNDFKYYNKNCEIIMNMEMIKKINKNAKI